MSWKSAMIEKIKITESAKFGNRKDDEAGQDTGY